MAPLLLAVDIGNTNVVVGVWSGDGLMARWRIATDRHRMADEYAVLLHSLFELAHVPAQSVEGAIICSVVPVVQAAMRHAIVSVWGREPVVVSSHLDTGMELRYSPPESAGPDRIANAVAALRICGAPAIVVDFGTATTLDAISADGAYVGGSIAPGLQISVDALYAHAARLLPVPLEAPPSPIGDNTANSLQSGILYGYAGLADGLVGRFQELLGPETAVIGTGGLAQLVAPHTRTVRRVDRDLTLLGLRILFERNWRAADIGSRQNQSLA